MPPQYVAPILPPNPAALVPTVSAPTVPSLDGTSPTGVVCPYTVDCSQHALRHLEESHMLLEPVTDFRTQSWAEGGLALTRRKSEASTVCPGAVLSG